MKSINTFKGLCDKAGYGALQKDSETVIGFISQYRSTPLILRMLRIGKAKRACEESEKARCAFYEKYLRTIGKSIYEVHQHSLRY